MDWQPAQKVQKNDAGEFRAMIGGEWVPVAKAQKNEAGEYRVMMGEPQTKKDLSKIDTELTFPEKLAMGADKFLKSIPKPVRQAIPIVALGENVDMRPELSAAASGPVAGMTQYLADKVGAEGVSKAIAKTKEAGKDANFGMFLQPEMWLTGKAAGNFINKGGNLLTQSIRAAPVGAAYGATQAQSEEDNGLAGRAVEGLKSGATAALATPVGHYLAKGAGTLIDVIKGRLADVKGGKILRDVAGEKIDDIMPLLRGAGDDVTAAQAAAPAGSDKFSALGKVAEKQKSQYFTDLADKQAANRVSTLKGVQPDLKEAETARDVASKINYGKAFDEDLTRLKEAEKVKQAISLNKGRLFGESPEPLYRVPQEMMENPIVASAAKEATILAKSRGENLGNPLESLKGLHYMKLAIDNQFKNRGASTALQQYSDDALRSTKARLLSVIEGNSSEPGISPAYKVARQEHARLSEPVNQSKVIAAITDSLKNPAGMESSTPFLNVLGKGEDALLKRADQTPRFGGIKDVLTDEQMSAVEKVSQELIRDKKLAERASAGMGELRGILPKDLMDITIPNQLDVKVSMANRAIKLLTGDLNEKTMDKVYNAMRNGKDAAKLMEELPTAERNKVLKFILDNKLTLPISGAAAQGD